MRAVVMGGTGLVGLALLQELSRARIPTVSLARRIDLGAPRVEWRVLTSMQLSGADIPAGSTTAFCALGTTIRKAGSQPAFRAVDHDLVLRFARACHEAGVKGFHVVSAAGAAPKSRIFYSRVKGETEEGLKQLGFPTLGIYRPSLLLGKRSERRPAERAAIGIAKALSPVLPARWRGITPHTVARAMVREGKIGRPGVRVLENADLHRLGAATQVGP